MARLKEGVPDGSVPRAGEGVADEKGFAETTGMMMQQDEDRFRFARDTGLAWVLVVRGYGWWNA